MKARARRSFAPWRIDFAMAGFAVAIGAALLTLAMHAHSMSTTAFLSGASFLSVVRGVALWRDGWLRLRGKRIEASSLSQLRKCLAHPDSLRENVPIPGLGDADGVVERDGRRWVLEIKSKESVRLRRHFFVFARLEGAFGQPLRFAKDPFEQAHRAAQRLTAAPVLWFPAAVGKGTASIRGVQVVCGPAKYLAKVMRWA